MTPAQLAKIGKQGTPVEGPVVNSSSAVFVRVNNDAMLIFGRPRPLIIAGVFANLAINDTVAVIHMSMPALKDLYITIGDDLSKFEAENGEIVTLAMKARDAAKK